MPSSSDAKPPQTLEPLSTGSGTAVVPAFGDPSWLEPASADDAFEAVVQVAALVEPDMTEARRDSLAGMMELYCDPERTQQPYTRAELLLAVREVPRDPEAGHNFGDKGMSLSDIERVIRRHRTLVAKLTQRHLLTSVEVDKLCGDVYRLDRTHFGCSGFDQRTGEQKLWRYVPGGASRRADVPQPPRRDD